MGSVLVYQVTQRLSSLTHGKGVKFLPVFASAFNPKTTGHLLENQLRDMFTWIQQSLDYGFIFVK